MRAFDDLGNEVFPVQIKTIAPIEFAEEARGLSHQYTQGIDCTDPLESMLPVSLRPMGEETATHIFCVRSGYTHELQDQLSFLASREEEWISGDLETDPETILTKFCTFDADLESDLGLEVC